MTNLLKHAWVKLNAVLVKHPDKYILPLAADQLLRFIEWLIERSERRPGEISGAAARQDPA